MKIMIFEPIGGDERRKKRLEQLGLLLQSREKNLYVVERYIGLYGHRLGYQKQMMVLKHLIELRKSVSDMKLDYKNAIEELS